MNIKSHEGRGWDVMAMFIQEVQLKCFLMEKHSLELILQRIMKLFQEISAEGTSVIMVTHELDTIRFGNKVYQMDEGTLKEDIDAAIA